MQVLTIVAVVNEGTAVICKALSGQADIAPCLTEHQRGDAKDRKDDHIRYRLYTPTGSEADEYVVLTMREESFVVLESHMIILQNQQAWGDKEMIDS